MQNWINFFLFCFWISLIIFLFNPTNFITLLFFSELSWLVLYSLSLVLGIFNDDLNLITLSFLILGLAGLEFSFAFLLLILFKSMYISLNFFDNEKSYLNLIFKEKNLLKSYNF